MASQMLILSVSSWLFYAFVILIILPYFYLEIIKSVHA